MGMTCDCDAAQNRPVETCERSSTSAPTKRMNTTSKSTACFLFVESIEIPVATLKEMAAGEGVEPSSSSSKPDVLPVTPSRKKVTGHWDSNPEPRADLALKPLIRRLLYRLSYAPLKLVAVEGIEPTSLDYQSSALAVELHRDSG